MVVGLPTGQIKRRYLLFSVYFDIGFGLDQEAGHLFLVVLGSMVERCHLSSVELVHIVPGTDSLEHLSVTMSRRLVDRTGLCWEGSVKKSDRFFRILLSDGVHFVIVKRRRDLVEFG